MEFTYEWEVTGLKVRDQVNVEGNPLTSAVIQTYWKLTGTDQYGNKAEFSGATPFSAKNVPQELFVPFEELEEEDVIGWIKAVVHSDPSFLRHINEQFTKTIERETEVERDALLPWKPESEQTSMISPGEAETANDPNAIIEEE